MERQLEPISRSLPEAFIYSAVKVIGWALPVVASSLLVLWIQKKLNEGSASHDEEVIIIPKMRGSF